MIQLALGIEKETLKKAHADYMSACATSLGLLPVRIRNSFTNGMLGILLLDWVCQSLGQPLEVITGHTRDDFGNALAYAIREYLLAGSNHNRSSIEEGLAVMFARMNLTSGKEYKYLHGGSQIALDINGVFDNFSRYIRSNGLTSQIEQLSRQQFVQQLKQKNFFLESRAVRFHGINPKQAVILDASILRERIGEDLPAYTASPTTVA